MSQFGIPLAALIISIMTYVMTEITRRKSTEREYITTLEARVQSLQAQLGERQKENLKLKEENLYLMRRIVTGDPFVIDHEDHTHEFPGGHHV